MLVLEPFAPPEPFATDAPELVVEELPPGEPPSVPVVLEALEPQPSPVENTRIVRHPVGSRSIVAAVQSKPYARR